MFMRMAIADSIKTGLPKTNNAKKFMGLVGEHSQIADKSLAGTLMSTLTTMKFDGSRTMHEHVIEMKNIAARLDLGNGCEWELSSSVYSKLITI